MKKEKRLLFFGELPPESIHGVSISNNINIKLLKKSFKIDIIQELSILTDHDKISYKKIFHSLWSSLLIINKSIFYRYDYFYLVFSLSTFGAIKTLASIICFKIFNRGKIVLHLHRGDFFSGFYTGRLKKLLANLNFKLSSKIIVLSEEQKSEFEKIFSLSFFVLKNTVETEFQFKTTGRNLGQYLYISNYLIDKGIFDLLEAFDDISRNNKLISIQTFGAFPDSILKEKILNYSSDNIFINGPIYGLEKIEKIAESHCLVLPSWNEGQPIILLEAMSVGTPIIATNVGLIPELLGVDYPYLFAPKDIDSLKKMLIQIYNQNDNNHISQYLKNRYYNLYSMNLHETYLKNIFI